MVSINISEIPKNKLLDTLTEVENRDQLVIDSFICDNNLQVTIFQLNQLKKVQISTSIDRHIFFVRKG